MSKQATPVTEDGARPARVQDIKEGEYVKLKPDAKKVYKRGAYNASIKGYWLHDCDDINRIIKAKRGTTLYVGFTY